MKKTYTKKQITEAIAYWEKQLRAGNYRKLNESRSTVNESAISDFFAKVFKTKKFLAAQDELVKQKNYKEHPLMKIAEKMANDPSNRRYIVRFTNVDVENDGYPVDINYKLDCIVLALSRDGANRYDNIADDKDEIMELAKKCGLPSNFTFYAVGGLGVIADIHKGMNIVNVNESDDEFEKIDDIIKYLKDKKLKWIKVVKFQRLNAVQSEGGEEVETVGSDGNVETKRKTKKGDWIVNNVSNKDNKWIVSDETFKKKYEEEKDGIYKPKGGPMLAAKIADCTDKGVEFAPPNWGGDVIKVKNDGWLMKDPSNEKDIYAISKKDFDTTYKKQG